ncbi:aminotransferase class IV [Candidatus Peregrinibacteria bacterium]|nr:aminotransferase class IV [Candidatus Peregrinibacteria bacterium]
MVVYLNGKFVNARDAKISIFDPGFLYGDGIFETLRTYRGKIWQMEEHLQRLYESARMRGWKLSWSEKELAEVVEKSVLKNNFPESRVRVTITPGVKQPTLFIWVAPLEHIPARAYTEGVSVITFPLERPFPQMKTTSIQPLLIARSEMAKKRVFEALLINRKGNITEGTWTNVFIIKRKTLITPRLGVLLGTTRDTVLKLAKSLFRIKLRDISRQQLMRADECFLTNAPKGIIPVVRVDGEKIRTGRVGPITKHLQKEFEKRVWKNE